MPKIVIFPHPSGEHGRQSPIDNTMIDYSGKKYIRWNNGEHARKFLKNEGKILYQNGEIEEGNILFWCEWEPQSKILKDFGYLKKEKELPNYIQFPFWDVDERIQNTDPFIFGKNFYWAFCRQNRQPELTNIERGDIILFGSILKKEFVLDTLFVVKDYIDYNWSLYHTGKLSAITKKSLEYDEITLKAGSCGTQNLYTNFRFYIGNNYDNLNSNNIFSFFPAQMFTDNLTKGFKRPVIDLSIISNNPDDLKLNPQSAKIIQIHSQDRLKDIWEKIVTKVREKTEIGIFTEIPKKHSIPYKNELQKTKTKYPPVNNLDEGVYKIAIKIIFQSNRQHGALIGNQNRSLNPTEFNPVIYIDKSGFLRATLWDGKSNRTLLSKKRVDDNQLHSVIYLADLKTNTQLIYLDTKESIHDILNPERENKIVKGKLIEYKIDSNNLHSKYFWQIGTAYSRNKPKTNGFWFTFDGLIKEVIIKTNKNSEHYKYIKENE